MVATTVTDMSNSNSFGQRQAVDNIQVTNFYFTLTQEFGALVAGRVPQQFGLGITHSAGNGLFDHYYDNRDMVAYKMVFGNSYFMPSIAKVVEGGGLNDNAQDISEFNFHFQYENADTDLEMGIYYRQTKSSQGNDTPIAIGGVGATMGGNLDTNVLNVYAIRDRANFRWALELSFEGGKTGVLDVNGENVGLSGFGVAGEFGFKPTGSKYNYGFNIGHATGDDESTTDKYEGYHFDRNYDVALLMFNHQLGQADVLRNSIIGGGATTDNTLPDVETISNVTYIAPYAMYNWKEHLDIKATLVTGILNDTTPGAFTLDKSLGYELDLELIFKPHESLTWSNQLAYFVPGSAFEFGSLNLETNSVLALFSKVAISF